MSKILTILFLSGAVLFILACSQTSDSLPPPGLDSDADTDADSDTDSDSDSDTDSDGDVDADIGSVVDDPSSVQSNCNNTLKVTFRDFKASHSDFELDVGEPPNDIWPSYIIRGMVATDLGSDGNPVFTGTDACWVTGSNCFSMETEWNPNIPNPMPHNFNDWYNDVPGVNQNIEKYLVLGSQGSASAFDSSAFFPIDGQGFGEESGQNDTDGDAHNFLFTTEIHTAFLYEGGEEFSFRGDDDLWIFVNGKLAMDLGGLHPPEEDTINFDAMATELGISVGNTYDLDIFHAERHTVSSNFRIETSIECFVPTIE